MAWIITLNAHNILIDWAKECNCRALAVKIRDIEDNKRAVVIYTDKPGCMIGKAGCILDKYEKLLREVGYDVVLLQEMDTVITMIDEKFDPDEVTSDYFRSRGF